MGFDSRLAKAEASVSNALLWAGALRIADETGERPEDIYAEALRLAEKYDRYEVRSPGGMVDIEPAIRAIANDEGLDYDELLAAARQDLRRLNASIRRRQRNARR